MTQLRKMMLEELQRRNYSQQTTKAYLRTIWQFAKYFHRSPAELGREHIREFQAHLSPERKLSGNSVAQRTAALRFFVRKDARAELHARRANMNACPCRAAASSPSNR